VALLPSSGLAHVVLRRTGAPVPDGSTPGWSHLRECPDSRLSTYDEGWVYGARLPLGDPGGRARRTRRLRDDHGVRGGQREDLP
jgi:hypothetical protein